MDSNVVKMQHQTRTTAGSRIRRISNATQRATTQQPPQTEFTKIWVFFLMSYSKTFLPLGGGLWLTMRWYQQVLSSVLSSWWDETTLLWPNTIASLALWIIYFVAPSSSVCKSAAQQLKNCLKQGELSSLVMILADITHISVKFSLSLHRPLRFPRTGHWCGSGAPEKKRGEREMEKLHSLLPSLTHSVSEIRNRPHMTSALGGGGGTQKED